jgi:hypothetical protein
VWLQVRFTQKSGSGHQQRPISAGFFAVDCISLEMTLTPSDNQPINFFLLIPAAPLALGGVRESTMG